MANVEDLFNCFNHNEKESISLRPIADEDAEK